MIKLHFSSTYCTFSDIPPEVEEQIYSLLSYQPEGYFYSPKFQSRVWDGFVRLYQPKHKRFKTGLYEKVLGFLYSNNIPYEVLGFPEAKGFTQRTGLYELRPYQLDVVNTMLSRRFGIIQSPPRSGKTIMMIAAVDSERLFPAVCFCRSVDLAKQTVAKFNKFLPDVRTGIIGDGSLEIVENGITVATIQSVFSAFDKKYDKEKGEKLEAPIVEKQKLKAFLPKIKMLFYDEAHHLKDKNTSSFVVDKCVNTEFKIGLSATPFSAGESELVVESAIGPVLCNISYSELIKEGFLLPPNIVMYKLPKDDNDGNYQAVYKSSVIDNEFLAGLVKKIVNKLISQNISVVVQTEFINHTKVLGKLLGCEILTGKDSSEKRERIISQLEKKEILCVVSTLFEEGLDIPTLGCTINVAGGLSNISTLQRMRSTTMVAGKTSCAVVDFYHQSKYLRKHSSIRKGLYKAEPEFKFRIIDVSKKSLEEIS